LSKPRSRSPHPKATLLRAGLRCGIVSPLVWLGVLGFAMLVRPEFSPVADYISELGEVGSTTERVVRYAGFEFTGLLYVVFAIAAATLMRGGLWSILASFLVALDGIGRIGAGVYPCDLGCESVSATQELHRLFATVGFCSGVLAALAWGVVARRHAWLRGFANASTGAGLLTTALLLLMTWDANPFPFTGLYEHLATVVLSVWTLALAVRLVGRAAETADAVRQAVPPAHVR
jgi:hypothetical membrane protein